MSISPSSVGGSAVDTQKISLEFNAVSTVSCSMQRQVRRIRSQGPGSCEEVIRVGCNMLAGLSRPVFADGFSGEFNGRVFAPHRHSRPYCRAAGQSVVTVTTCSIHIQSAESHVSSYERTQRVRRLHSLYVRGQWRAGYSADTPRAGHARRFEARCHSCRFVVAIADYFESESIHAARTNVYIGRPQEYSLARPMVDPAALCIRFVADATHRLLFAAKCIGPRR